MQAKEGDREDKAVWGRAVNVETQLVGNGYSFDMGNIQIFRKIRGRGQKHPKGKIQRFA